MDYRWDDVRVFLAVWRHRTFTAAAQQLDVEVSTVSRRLAAFEDALGARLFDRTTDGLLPSAAAEEILAAAERAESAAQEVARAAGGLERTPTGLVRITAVPGLAETFLSPLIPRLFALHPGLRVSIHSSQEFIDLTRNEADLSLRMQRPVAGDLVVQKLADIPYVLATSKAVARKTGTVSSVEQLRALPWIAWPQEFAMIPAQRWITRHAGDSAPVVMSNSLSAQLRAAEVGAGVGLAPKPFMRQMPGLMEIPLSPRMQAQCALPHDELWMVVHRALRNVPRVKAVWDFILARVAEAPFQQECD